MISMTASGKIFDVDGFANEILDRIVGKPPTLLRRRTSCESREGSVDTAALSDSASSDGEEEEMKGDSSSRRCEGFLVCCKDVTLRFKEDVMKRCRSLLLAQSDCDRGRQEEDDDGKWQDVQQCYDSSVDEDLEALNKASAVQYDNFLAWNSFREMLMQERQAALRQSIANGRRLLWQPSSSSCSESFDEDDGGGGRHDR